MDESTRPDQSVREKLNGMFSRYDYVGVKNILKTEFRWKVALEQNEVVGTAPGDPMNEERMAQTPQGTFLPGDSVTRHQQRVTEYVLKPGEKKMIIGEAAYVIVPRLFNAYCRETFGTSKAGLARLRNPSTQQEIIPTIVDGPIINNIGDAMQTFVNDQMTKIEGFTDVQPEAPKGFANPEIAAKARATREANKATKV